MVADVSGPQPKRPEEDDDEADDQKQEIARR